ncbi:hypothetical protein CBL_00862 [Carabus blaptoides fortunei]
MWLGNRTEGIVSVCCAGLIGGVPGALDQSPECTEIASTNADCESGHSCAEQNCSPSSIYMPAYHHFDFRCLSLTWIKGFKVKDSGGLCVLEGKVCGSTHESQFKY